MNKSFREEGINLAIQLIMLRKIYFYNGVCLVIVNQDQIYGMLNISYWWQIIK